MARVDYRNRRAEVTKLPDGRLRVVRRADVLSEVRTDSELNAEVWLEWGTADEQHAAARLIGQALAPLDNTATDGSRVLTRVYEELHATDETQVGGLRRVTDDNGRDVLRAEFLQFSAAPATPGTVGTTTAPGDATAVLHTQTADDDGTLRRITRDYVEAAAAEAQVGGDEISRDDNGRRVLTRRFVQLASAAYVEGTIGAAAVTGGVTYALAGETKGETLAVRTIVRRHVEATAAEVQVGGDELGKDENGRRTLERTYVQLASAAYVEGTIGAALTVSTVAYALTGETKGETAAVRTIRRRYIEVSAAEVQVGGLPIGVDENGRHTITRTFVQLTSAAYVQGTIGSGYGAYAVAYALTGETKSETAAVRTIVRRYIEANTVEAQVGGDRLGIDENGRRTLTRTFVQAAILPSSPYVQGTIGSAVTVSAVTYALTSETKAEDAAVRTIVRTYIEATTTVTQVGADRIGRDENGRRTIQATWVQLRAGSTYTPPAPGDAYGATGCVFSTEQESGSLAVRVVTRTYVEVTATLAEIGWPVYSRDDDDRKRVARTFAILPLSAGAEPATLSGAVGSETFDGCVCARAYVVEHTRARAIIRKEYIQATSTPAQIGDVVAGAAGERAFVGTSSGAVIATTRLARTWTVQYIVAGDATTIDTHWLALNATMAFGARTGYFHASQIVRKGVGYCIIQRGYVEKPDSLKYYKRAPYTFPGRLAYSSSLGPYVDKPATTRETSFEIVETYHVGEPTADAVEYEVGYWSQGLVTYTRATGEEGAKSYAFTGVLGSFGISISNKIFDGALCATAAGGVASSPAAYPTGKKLISSKPERWIGDIWVKRNIYLTFP